MSLRFGDYDVETLLGPGGVTETYRAHRNGHADLPVALKLLRTDRGGTNEKVISTFTDLGLRNGEIRVPGLARVLEVSGDPGHAFVITELVPGVDLETLWNNAAASGAIDYNMVAAIGAQIARVLSGLHERKDRVVHGALCPGNVIVTGEGKVVLTDVGFSAALRNLTEFPIDKWWYVAPELLLTKMKPTPASDLYSLGALLYFLLSGEPPVMGDTRAELAEQIEDAPPSVPGVPDWIELAINNLLSKNPDDRPRSAAAAALALTPPAALSNKLSRIVSGPGAATSPLPPPPAVSSARPLAASAARPAAAPASAKDDDLPELDALPGLDLLDSPGVPAVGPPSLDLPAIGKGTMLGPSAFSPAPAPQGPETGPLPTLKPLKAAGPGPNPPEDVNEPEWVDDVSAPAVRPGHKASSDDDFFDLPSTAKKNVLSAAGAEPGSHTMDLPDLPDAPVDLGPKVVDLPMMTSSTGSVGSRADQGIHDEEDRLGGPIDMDQVGMVDYVADDEDGAVAGVAGSPTTGAIVLPRRAGSARAGGPGVPKLGISPVAIGIFLMVMVGGGIAAKKFFFTDEMLPPPPARSNTPGKAADPAAEAAAQKRATAQEQASAPSRGMLTLETSPRGATVWIDGVERGHSPLTTETTPGAHRIVLTKPGFRMLREVADTSEGMSLKRTLPPANINFGGQVALTVECKTEGKYPVFIDGRDTGLLCPLKDVMIAEGNRLIGLYVVPQNKIWSFEREIVAGSKTHRVIFSY